MGDLHYKNRSKMEKKEKKRRGKLGSLMKCIQALH